MLKAHTIWRSFMPEAPVSRSKEAGSNFGSSTGVSRTPDPYIKGIPLEVGETRGIMREGEVFHPDLPENPAKNKSIIFRAANVVKRVIFRKP